MTEDSLGKVATELALPGNNIFKRHIATRASNRRQIIVLVTGDVEFEGYAIGLDGGHLQIVEIPEGDVHSLSLSHIVSISDGKNFSELTREEKDAVDRRTASFMKRAHAWLVDNWPDVYDRRDEGHPQSRQRFNRRAASRPATGHDQERLVSDGYSEVRDA